MNVIHPVILKTMIMEFGCLKPAITTYAVGIVLSSTTGARALAKSARLLHLSHRNENDARND